ncbi:MAG TPA: tetratricopeptide repeat protein [Deltaproteobacteria bacterium]|nr:tetratricopeptide repeat protein [Deltaproteobacteria bacterium]
MRIVSNLLVLSCLLVSCAGKRIAREDIEDGLPPWMTEGEEVRLAIAWDLIDSYNTLGALEIVRQMRSEGFSSPELDLLQGKALLLDGVTSEAERLLLAAQKRMPRDSRPPSELCVLYADEGRIEQALAQCQRAADLDDSNAKAWNNLSFLLLAAERARDAIKAAEQAVLLDGADPRYRNNLGLAQAALGRTEVAFRTLGSTMPQADAAYMVGLAVERFESYPQALPWYERALESNPNHPGAQQKLEPPDDGAQDAPVEEP